jgi:hypothetical protein
MRFRLLLLALPVLLGACSKTNGPVRLDFIGLTGLTSGNRTVGPGDTLNTRAYAEGTDANLTSLRVTVKYEPGRNPIIYPTPLSSYDPSKAVNDDERVYLDSLVDPATLNRNADGSPRGGAFLLANKFAARTTSGTELWQYTATDANKESATRLLRLTVRKADSAAVYHSYTIRFRPVVPTSRPPANAAQLRDQALVFLNLHSGLLLPKYALINNSGSVKVNQQLVDLICVASSTTSIALLSPTDMQSLLLNPTTWPITNRRPTQLRATTLNGNAFASSITADSFNAAFAAGTAFPDSYSTGALQVGQVIAFQVTENGQDYRGLLLVSGIVAGSAPLVTCQVKVQK